MIELNIISTVVQRSLEGRPVPTGGNTIIVQGGGSVDVDAIVKEVKEAIRNDFLSSLNDDEAEGVIDFLNGLKIGGLPISKYEGYDDVIYIDANVVLRGGLTQYVVDPVTIPSIIESLPQAGYESKGVASFSDKYFVIDTNGKVSIIPDSVGLNEEELTAWLASSDYATKTYVGGQLESYALQSALTATNNTLATKWTQDDDKIANWDTSYSWGNHASAGYVLSTEVAVELAKYLPLSGGKMSGDIVLPNRTYIRFAITSSSNPVAILGFDGTKYLVSATNYATTIRSNGTLKHNSATIWDSNTLTSLSQLNNDADFTTNAYVNETFVTLKGDPQTIEGDKNFTGGLKVNGSPIVYDSENGYWKLQGNLLITGGLTQYVDDGSVDLPNLYDGLPIDGSTIYWDNGLLKAKVAEGGITSITDTMVIEALGFTPYDATNPNGYITSSALSGYATQTWVNQQGFLTEHQDLSGYQPKITSSAKLAASLVSGLAAVATSGSYNDLSNKPTIPTSLKSPYALSWSGYSSGSYDGSSAQSITIPSNTNQLTNGAGFITSSALSSYLPLSGGQIDGNLIINRDPSVIFFKRGGATLGSIGFNGDLNPVIYNAASNTAYNLWHSGNSNLSSVDWNASKLILNTTNTTDWNVARANNTIQLLRTGVTAGNAPLTYCSGISIMTSYTGFQLASYGGAWNDLYFRSIQDNDTWLPWRTVAFTDSNVASATKLQTARKIWGQSFDGTGDVNGKLKLTSWDSDGVAIRLENSSAGNALISTYSYASNAYDFGQKSNRFIINHNTYGEVFSIANGNVGIGATSPAYKLEVNGNGRFNKYLAIGASLSQSNTARAQLDLVSSDANPCDLYLGADNTKYWSITARNNADATFGGKGLGFWDAVNSTYRMCITQSGNVGIGITGPSVKLHVSGDILSTGGITQYSDIRKKTKLQDVELTLKQVANAPLIEHYYNSDDKKTTHVGSIAQYWAGLNDWFCKLDSDGFYTMEIQNAALASAISVARELERYESKTDKKIRLLKKRINELEDEIEILKKGA